MKVKYLFYIACIVFGLFSCDSDRPVYNPKPRAYPKINFPKRAYTVVAPETCPFSFERANYAEFVQDSMFFGEKTDNDCWFDLYEPSLEGTIHCSYYKIDALTNVTIIVCSISLS